MKRLTPALLTLFMFGIIGLLILGYFAKNLFAQKEKPAAPTLREVPMAITDIRPGTVISADHLGMGRYDRNKLTPDVLLSNRVIVGRVAREPIKAASPIKAGQLYQPGELPPLDIGPGMRAVSVEVGDGVAMVDGIIKPGDTVDVLFTAQVGGAGGDQAYQGGLTMRLFEGVKVLAINRNFSQGRVDKGNNHVTLELSVAQTNIVVLAKDRGKITLTYNPNGRGNGGLALSNSERVTLFELLGLQKADPILEPFRTDVYRGSKVNINRFDVKGRRVDERPQMTPNNQYVLPNNDDVMPSPGGGPKSANTTPDSNNSQTNGQPLLQVVPSRDAIAPLPPLNAQPQPRMAPTAQLPKLRSSL